MIDWDWAGVNPPEVGQPLRLEYDDGVVNSKIVSLIDMDGDETDDPEMCYVVVVEREDGFFEAVDFYAFYSENKATLEKLN